MTDKVFLLKNVGFTDHEAKAYLTLLEFGSMTGYKLSIESGVSRSKIYNVLESLRDKGAVLISKQSEPINYAAVSIDEVIESFQSNLKRKLNQLSKEVSMVNQKQDLDQLWYIKGYDNIFSRCRSMIREAKESVLIQIWEEDLPELLEELKEFESKSTQIVVILFSIEKNYDCGIKNVYAHGMETTMLEENKGLHWINLVVDEKYLVFGHLQDRNAHEVIWTTSPSMVFLAKENIRHDGYSLKILSHMSDSEKEIFGKDMIGIKDLF